MEKNPVKITAKSAFNIALMASSLAFSTSLYAASWLNGDNELEPGTTIQAINANSNKNSYTSNPALVNRAWGMQGSWLSFEVKAASDVLISLSSKDTNAPGFTVYRTDGPFSLDNATGTAAKDEIEGAKHAFNQVAQAGDPGLVWATDNDVTDSIAGNTSENGILETLGYVNGSSRSFVNYWGYKVDSGAHDLSIDNRYENGVYGSIAYSAGPEGDTNYANLTLVNSQPGFYTIFLGGTDSNGEDTPIDVKVTAIPLSAADCLLNYQEQQNPADYPHNSGLNSKTIDQYYYRHYAETNNYLGVSSDNHLYSMNGATSEFTDLGDTSALMAEAGCE